MNNSDDLALSLLKTCREMITLLQNSASIDLIIDKMDQRDTLVIALEKSVGTVTNADVMMELIRLRNEEKTLLKPYIDELHDIRQVLIGIKQIELYHTANI